jgi:hypothetical protein
MRRHIALDERSCQPGPDDLAALDLRSLGLVGSEDDAMISELEQHLVRRELEMLSDADLVRWARAAIRQDDAVAADPDVIELASLRFGNPRLDKALGLLRSAVTRANPNFDIRASEPQAYGRAMLVQICRRYLDEDLPPYEVCRVVGAIEGLFEYPSWLGDFNNHCDWCEPSSTRSHFDHLAEYVAQFLAEGTDAHASTRPP